MKQFKSFSVASILFALMLAALAFTLSRGSLQAQPVAAQSIEWHKAIVPAGLLDGEVMAELLGLDREGIVLWHDYGSFGLYRISNIALDQLPDGVRRHIRLADEMDKVLLDAYPFNTQTDSLDIPQALQLNQVRGSALHLIQFVGPIKDAWLEAVEETGSVPIHYMPNNAYLVWADSASRAQLDALVAKGDFLQYSLPYQPYFKLGVTLIDRVTALTTSDEVIPVMIQMYRHADTAVTESLIADAALDQLSPWSSVLDYQNTIVTLRVSDIATLVQQPDVVWIGEHFERELLDEVQGQIVANQVTGGSPTAPGYLPWLTGLGFSTTPADYPIVDVVDDGIGNGTVNSGDPTFHEMGLLANPTRLAYVSNCTNSPSGEGVDGHGHINTSIVGGYDTRAGFPFQDPNSYQRGLGINPFARLAGTRIFDPGFDLSSCGGTDTGLIKSSQDDGAQITSNSWGCSGCAFQYDSSSQAFDVGVRDADLTEAGNQEMIMIFAAGNSGPSAGTVGTPGNGKNMITVGASENVRPSDEGGAWTDGCGITPSGADDWRDVIFFSSRGPSPGGRVKPEVIAPGTHVQGTASTNAGYTGFSVCDKYRPAGQTTFAASSGTSHSTPAVAGAASLYYYWLENNYSLTPSPAMMKSYMIAHPTYLTGVGANDTLPSNSQGYGMPNLETAFDDADRYLLDQTVVFDNSGETWTWSGTVADSTRPVRIVMAYTDQAGPVGTSPQVNNINLAASVGGTAYLGNVYSGQWSITGGTADNANNYEAIFLPAGTTGNIDITVTAFNIAGDGVPNVGDATDQDFALVCYNCTDNTGGGSGSYIWQDHATGTEVTNIAWDYAMGYHFTPEVDGFVTELGGFFNGTKTVRLFNTATGTLLAEATVTDNNNWGYSSITPVPVYSGVQYTVAAYLAGSGASYRYGVDLFPQVYDNVRIDGTTFIYTGTDPNARPINSYPNYMFGQADIRFQPAADSVTPWQDNANGTQITDIAWDYAMGYHFVPQVDGFVTELGGFFNGTKTVKLFEKASGTLLAQTTVTAANNWGYAPITPVPVDAGVEYTVAVYLAGSGGSYRYSITPFPQLYGDIQINGSTYAFTGTDPNAVPTNTVTTVMYGQADMRFQPALAPVMTWQENAGGTQTTGVAWDYAMGYHFIPQTDGVVTQIGGLYNGAKIVRLFNKGTGALLAEATVTSTNNWSYADIAPVRVDMGVEYTVAVYLAGSGGSYRTGIALLPQVYGDVQITGSTYAFTGTDPNARPTNYVSNVMFGQADITFVPLPPGLFTSMLMDQGVGERPIFEPIDEAVNPAPLPSEK